MHIDASLVSITGKGQAIIHAADNIGRRRVDVIHHNGWRLFVSVAEAHQNTESGINLSVTFLTRQPFKSHDIT